MVTRNIFYLIWPTLAVPATNSGRDKLTIMESKIQIDIDGDGQPRIKIDYKLTEDLRDRLVGRFLYKMGIPVKKSGFWAYCRLGHETNDGGTVFIEPMDENILSLHLPEINSTLSRLEGDNSQPPK